MAAARNPFTPTFGASPVVLAGRDAEIDDIVDGLETGPGHPEYTSILTGPRGVGKTVALNEIQNRARTLGWLVIALDASSGRFIGALTAECRRLLDGLEPPRPKRRVKGVKAGGVGIDFEVATDAPDSRDLRALLTALGGTLAGDGTGLLVTVDELHSADVAEVREFGAVIQHVAKREGHPVAFAAAALSQLEDQLLRGDQATFLQRCSWHELGPIPLPLVGAALRETIELAGRSVSDAALALAAEATSGYAFMVQLVGHHMWNAARGSTGAIGVTDARTGIAEANRRMGRLVFTPQWKPLSDMDRAFLRAMVDDDGPSRIGDIARRLDRSPQYVNTYRDRLIRSGWIRPTKRGVVELTHHAAREWLRDRR